MVVLAFIVVGCLAAGIGVYLLEQNKRSLPAPLQALLGGKLVKVLGGAMYPTLQDGQVVTFDTRAYRDHAPRRGDIVVFAPPGERARLFITRVIAIPGDRVRITNGVLAINGKTVPEPYVSEKWSYANTWPVAGNTLALNPNDYFVMGDNRDHSMDSRSFGYIGREAILGKLLR